MQILLFALILLFLPSTSYSDDNLLNNRSLFKRPNEIVFRTVENVGEKERLALIELGKMIFFDPRFSANGLISCATCHNPSLHWTDGLPESIEGASRRSMSLYNLAWDNRFIWHGKAGSITSQAILALSAPKGMGITVANMPAKILAIPGYKKLVDSAFPQVAIKNHPFSPAKIALALEYYVSTIVSPIAPFDLWVNGDEHSLTDSEKRGFSIFIGKAGCNGCHSSWRFSDSNIYDIGLKLTSVEEKDPFFKAVGLRQIAERPPYMHQGQFRTLSEVVDFYDRGGDVDRHTKSKLIKPLNLTTSEKADLVNFLNSLSGSFQQVSYPNLPR